MASPQSSEVTRRPRRVEGRLARLAPVVVMGAVIVGFALLHVHREVPRPWAGWIVLAAIAPVLALAVAWLASAILRRARRVKLDARPAPGGSELAAGAEDPAPVSVRSRGNASRPA